MKKNRWKKLIIIVLVIVLLMLTVVPFGIGVYAYESSFDRYESYEPLKLSEELYDGLVCEDCEFSSHKDVRLAGYKLYNSENGDSFAAASKEAEAVVVIAHGLGGGGFNSYMNVADWFAAHDYVVFAYDATGNDNSGGKGVGGLPQGTSDLSAAIEYVESDADMSGLPIVLFGHSWGAFSVSNVLNEHPEVKAVVAISGWNKSANLIYEQGKDMAGEAGMDALLPYMMLYEKMKFGKYSTYTAVDGFRNTDAGVMIVHSADDKTIPIQYGYDLYQSEFGDDSRFVFVRYEDKGHNYVYNSSSAIEYKDSFDEQFRKDFGITDTGGKVDPQEKADYIRKNVDKKRLNELDEELFTRIDELYTKYCGR